MASRYPAVQMNVKAGMSRIDNNGMGITEYIEAADKIKTRV